MALLATQQVAPTGTIVTTAAATGGGDTVTPGDKTFLRVVNGGGSPITVTVVSPQLCSQGVEHDLAVAVANGATKDIGPLPSARYANASDGLVHVTYSGVSSVTVAAVAV